MIGVELGTGVIRNVPIKVRRGECFNEILFLDFLVIECVSLFRPPAPFTTAPTIVSTYSVLKDTAFHVKGRQAQCLSHARHVGSLSENCGCRFKISKMI